MINSSPQQSTNGKGLSLQSLLAAIDVETAPSLLQDLAFLKERALRDIRHKKPYISFVLGVHEMALPLESIQEIGYLPKVTSLPNLPHWIKGIVQIRSEILSVVDFIALFHLQDEKKFGLQQSYLLFKQQDLKFCLLVNRITGIVNIDEQRDTLTASASEKFAGSDFLSVFFRGVFNFDNRTICILDNEKLGAAPLIRKWQ